MNAPPSEKRCKRDLELGGKAYRISRTGARRTRLEDQERNAASMEEVVITRMRAEG